MKISENWLRQWANPKNTSSELGEQLTMAGLELDGMDTIAPPFSGVVVGEVTACELHPDADKLKITTVTIGGDPLQIVCGAPNVRAGLKVAVATVGAVLPPVDGKPFIIKKGKLRGVESFGMLCGASEIGLTDKIDGLLELPDDAPIGTDVREYLALDTMIFDVAITPNRGDCLSVLGLSREIAAINHLSLDRPTVHTAPITSGSVQAVDVQAQADCPRYLAQVIDRIDRNTPTPKWMADSLVASGVRLHDFLVDVTNFVLLELGQPLHAFDKDKVIGTIVVRHAVAGETLELLNDQTITLVGDELVIADDVGVLALAGIMGGKRSAVSDSTTCVVLESAFFAPLAIAGRSRRFGLHTDASQRFERGVDFELAPIALDRTVSLIVSVAGGDVGQITHQQASAHLPIRHAISTPICDITKLLGVGIDTQTAVDILERLGIQTSIVTDTLICTPPSHRFDLSIKEDIIEEIARIYGYHNIPASMPSLPVSMYDDTDRTLTLKHALASLGYFEAVSFSFSDAKIEALFDDDKLGNTLPLANPISSELAVMRRTLLSSLLPIVSYNLNRQQSAVRLFETGLSFVGGCVETLTQTPSLAMIATGNATDSIHGTRPMDFYEFKGDVECLLPTHLDRALVRYERADLGFLHPYQSAYLVADGQTLGWFGQLHPSIADQLDLPTVWVCQLDLPKLLHLHHSQPAITAPAKFPSVRRDLAFLVDESLSWQELATTVRKAVGRALTDLQLFDVYQGERLGAGKKSLAFAMTLQDPHATLDDKTIKELMDKAIVAATDFHQAKLRDS